MQVKNIDHSPKVYKSFSSLLIQALEISYLKLQHPVEKMELRKQYKPIYMN